MHIGPVSVNVTPSLRPDTCEYGDSCVKAHSEEELREWHMRTKEEEEISANMDAQGLMSYAESLRKEYNRCSNQADTVSPKASFERPQRILSIYFTLKKKLLCSMQ